MNRQRAYLAIDQGGHASRARLFAGDGTPLAHGEAELATQRPATDRVEHDPEALLDSVRAAIADALEGAGAVEVAAAGLAIQRSSIVCWHRQSGRALSPVLSWQDRRHARWLAAQPLDPARVHALTGLVVSPHYGASKLRWCLDHLPAVAEAAREGTLCAGPLASFVVFRLLAERPLVVDPANASRTLLWDVSHGDWSTEMLAAFGIERGILPACVPSRHAFGTLHAGKRRIPLRILAGDQSAALFAGGRPDPDTLYLNLGTGAFAQRPLAGTPPPAPGLLNSVVWQEGETRVHVLEATVNGAGSALDWLAARRRRPTSELVAGAEAWLAAETAPPLFLNGVGGLGSPWWRADAPIGFSAEATLAQETVAVIESIVFALAVNLERIQATSGPLRRVRAGGGLARLDGLCRRLAALSGIEVVRGAEVEATARGLGWLLAAPTAAWPEPPPARFAPAPDPALATRYRAWCAALGRALTARA